MTNNWIFKLFFLLHNLLYQYELLNTKNNMYYWQQVIDIFKFKKVHTNKTIIEYMYIVPKSISLSLDTSY